MATGMGIDHTETMGLIAALSLDEKLRLMAGESTWRLPAIKRLGIPNIKFSDGPSGARGEIFGESVPAAFFPSGVSLGATWDVDLMFEIGQALAEETKTKSASVVLAPTMGIHRHPLGGRNFESFSEDPFLTGKLAASHVRGVQSLGIGATPKHFVANDQETNRFHYDAVISERALREVYLLPFQMVVREANPWCMMTSYNRVNGVHADASKKLLTDITRGEWGWDGVFMSDWGGTTTTVKSINAGLDLELPGPPTKRSAQLLDEPLKNGLIDLPVVDDSARRVLELLQKTGRFQDASDSPEFCAENTEVNQLMLRAAASGIVMLKNEGNALPLKPDGMSKVAIVGPNARRVVAGGGGSSYIRAPYWTNIHDSLVEEFERTPTEIVSAVGARVHRYVPTMPPSVARNPDPDKPGAAVDWFLGHELLEKQATTHIDDLYFVCFGGIPPEIGRETDFSFRVRTTLKALTSGRYKLSFAAIGPATLFVDGEKVVSLSGNMATKGSLFFTYGTDETVLETNLEGGRDYSVVVEYHSHDRQLDPKLLDLMSPGEAKFQGIRIGYEEHDTTDLPAEAAALAEGCDAAVVVVGRDREWETEGQDIPIFELPGEQVRLIQMVASVCKRTIVLVQAGTPVQMEPWIHDVQAVLYVWYQGQELGNAAASVLMGKFNPSGRLPMTFPKRIQDCPAYSSFPGEQGVSEYSEGIHVGYRWWDLMDIEPLYPLGFGLSYNSFLISAEAPSRTELREGSPLDLPVRVRKVGGLSLAGRETVMAWASPAEPARLVRPLKQICAFAKTKPLLPGEETVTTLELDVKSLGVWDDERGSWVADAGTTFNILLGTNASNAQPAWVVQVPEEVAWLK